MLGHTDTLDRLEAALQTDTLVHGYLFEGPAGVGKFMAAKWLARRVLCINGTGCGHCAGCIKCDTDNHPDLYIVEPEGQSIKNRQISDFQKFAALRPNEGRYKVGILRNGETMTDSAQNRLLKMLEASSTEHHTLVLMTADQSVLILPTVRSRLQVLTFGRLSDRVLLEIAALNQWTVDPAALAFCDGSAEALKRFCEDDGFQTVMESVFDVLEALRNGKYVRAARHGDVITKKRETLQVFLELLTFALRDMLILLLRQEQAGTQLYYQAHSKILLRFSLEWRWEQLVRAIDETLEMQRYVHANVNAAHVFETLILRLQEVYCDRGSRSAF